MPERLSAKGRAAALLALAAIFAFSRTYLGIRHDAALYVGGALARLDPQGAGRDLIFTQDGQFGFSLYPPMLAHMIKALGLEAGALVVTAASLAVWLAALVFLARRLLADRPEAWAWGAAVLVMAVQPYYGAFDVFAYGESFAAPRILAEAAGLAAFGLYLGGRWRAALTLLLAAMAIHPIMALCGVGVLYVALCLRDRRWLIPGLAGGVLVLVAAGLGLPLAQRLLQPMDPVWRALCEARSPTIFVSLWPVGAWGRVAVQAVTLGLGVFVLQGEARRLALAALVVGLAGLIVSLALGDGLSLLLVLQAQPWRTQAGLAILAALVLVPVLARWSTQGPGGMVVACALGLAWIFIEWGGLAIGLAVLAGLMALAAPRVRWSAPRLVTGIALGLTGLATAAWILGRIFALVAAIRAQPADHPSLAALVWNSGLPGLAAALVATLLVMRPGLRPRPTAALAASLALAVVSLIAWDSRSAGVRALEARPPQDLKAMIASRPGEVLWLFGDSQAWALGRANWASKMQGAGIVFSRPVAVTLDARIDRLRAAGLVGEDWTQPHAFPSRPPSVVTAARLARLCAAPDAPAWVITARTAGREAARLPGELLWRPSRPIEKEVAGAPGGWVVADAYRVIPCAIP